MKISTALSFGLVLTAAFASSATSVSADTVVVPTGVSHPTRAFSFQRTIDGSGLSSVLTTGDMAPATAALYPTHVIAQGSTDVLNVLGRIQDTSVSDLIFDLGGSYDLTGMALWNYGERIASGIYFNDRGLNDFTLEFSSDGGTVYSTPLALNAAMAPTGPTTGLVTFAPELFTFAQSGVTHVRVAGSNHGGNVTGFTGFNEIVFTSAAIPEPSSLAVLALAGLTVLVRRRG